LFLAADTVRLMTAPLIFYKPCSIGDTYFRECLTCGAIVKNEGLHTLYHEQQASPKRCPKCGLLDIGRHICPESD
jgi:DNA-directed RNA polymerase subunit RPC12/RpoP